MEPLGATNICLFKIAVRMQIVLRATRTRTSRTIPRATYLVLLVLVLVPANTI